MKNRLISLFLIAAMVLSFCVSPSLNVLAKEKKSASSGTESTDTVSVNEESADTESADTESEKPQSVLSVINEEALIVGKGDTVYLSSFVSSNNYSENDLIYISADKKIAKVSENGGVYGKKAGTTEVTVSDPDGNSVTVSVIVKYAPSVLNLDKYSIKLNSGEYRKINATTSSKTAATVYFSSSDTGVCKVYSSGKIKAVKPGTCIITARTYNNVVTECAITVREPVKSIEYSFDKSKIAVGKTEKIKVTYLPEGSYEKIIWTSSNPEVAEVDSKGNVKIVGKGNAKITAYCEKTGQKKSFKVTGYYAKQIAITFDDGPKAWTSQILDALQKYPGAHVTFFMVGNLVSGQSAIVKRMYDEGHELGNHSWSHPDLSTLSAEDVASQITKTNNAIKKASGHYPTVLRPPYGSYNQNVRNAAGMPIITWSVDFKDWANRNADYVYRHLLSDAKDGAIILLHDLHKTSVEGFIRALPELIAQGYELVTVTELLSRDGSTPKKGSAYWSGPKLTQ